MGTCAVLLAIALAIASSEVMLSNGNAEGRVHCTRIVVGWYWYRIHNCEAPLPLHGDGDGSE